MHLWTPAQERILNLPAEGRVCLRGPAGTGKTAVSVARLSRLLESGLPAGQTLLLMPQRSLANPYQPVLEDGSLAPGGTAAVLTIGGLAQRMVEVFWPLAAQAAGFGRPERPPVFLTLETAQFFMARVVWPRLAQGYFDTLRMQQGRLFSQLIDNLNKAALVGFPIQSIAGQLSAAWVGDPLQQRIYEEAQECAIEFRRACLQDNLLDFSLQVDVFIQHLWPNPQVRSYLLDTYRHLLVENLEEHPPVAQDVLKAWLPECESAWLIMDEDGGLRTFLGADPVEAESVAALCEVQERLDEPLAAAPALLAWGEELRLAISDLPRPEDRPPFDLELIEPAVSTIETSFYPQMLDEVSLAIAGLIDKGLPPGEIVVLAPYLSDSLRYALTERLARQEIAVRTQRPSRALRDEAAANALITLTQLAHPQWGMQPSAFDVAYALTQAITGLDLVRAQLISKTLYKPGKIGDTNAYLGLHAFGGVTGELRERITYAVGERYDRLRDWLESYAFGSEQALDIFLARLFGEMISQPGFGFANNPDAPVLAAALVESTRKFRWAAADALAGGGQSVGEAYIRAVNQGLLAAQFLPAWIEQPEEAVFIAPATTFLMQNRPAAVQVWLDIGSRGWGERIEQPITHPYVLSRRWTAGRIWTEDDELASGREALQRLVTGLLRRCSEQVILAGCRYNEQGFESLGSLLRAINRSLSPAVPGGLR